MGLDVRGMVQRGDMENSECVLCGQCADACPRGVIAFGIKGRELPGAVKAGQKGDFR